jgi:hypothetical protein
MCLSNFCSNLIIYYFFTSKSKLVVAAASVGGGVMMGVMAESVFGPIRACA